MNRSRTGCRSIVLRRLHVLLGSAMLLVVLQSQAPAQSLSTRHVRQEIFSGEAQFQSRLPATQSLSLNISLPLRNEAQLDTLLQQLYDPPKPLIPSVSQRGGVH